MHIFESVTKTEYQTGVALGFFDGVHLGHKAVISQCVKVSGDNGCVPCVMTFKKSPYSVLKKTSVPLLTDNDKKASLIKECGAKTLYLIDFSDVMHLSAEEFVRDILHDKLNARFVFCGYNYRFGAGAKADTETLSALCKSYGIKTYISQKVTKDNLDISSTAIRQCIINGEIEKANAMLGYEFGFSGSIVSGNHIGGTKLDTPTINQSLPDTLITPKFGVYASKVTIDGVIYTGATNIGIHPTVGECKPVCETFLFDFDGDILYSKTADIRLIKFIRPEKKFDDISALSKQINDDKTKITDFFNSKNRIGN